METIKFKINCHSTDTNNWSVKNDRKIYSNKHTVVNIIPHGPKSLKSIAMA
jgi:hypothetical protein